MKSDVLSKRLIALLATPNCCSPKSKKAGKLLEHDRALFGLRKAFYNYCERAGADKAEKEHSSSRGAGGDEKVK